MTRTMKNSGVEWIGQIPASWKSGRIKDILNVLTDYTANGSFADLAKNVEYLDYESYARLVRLTDLRSFLQNYDAVYVDKNSYDYLSKSKLFGGEILVANVGAYAGLFCEMPKLNINATLGPNMFLITTNQKMLQHFLFYLGNSDIIYKQLSAKMASAAQPKLNKQDIKTTYLLIPPLSEQQAIADYLDDKCAQIDNITATINEQIEVLKQYKKSVITEAVTKGLDPNVPTKDSGVEWIGRIPKHWEVVKLKYALENNSEKIKVGPFGSTLKTSDYVDFGKWVYNQRTVLDNNFKSNSIFISEEKYNLLSGFKVNEDDILITTRGSIGKIAIVPKHFKEGILHPCLMKFRIDRVILNYQIIKHIFNNTDFIKEQFNYMSNGTTIDVIYSYNLKEIFLPVPSIHEQQAIADYLDDKCAQIDAVIANKQAQLETLAAYKKSLIYEYVTGKKSVPGFEEA